MRSLLFLGGGLLIGAGISWGEATRQAEKRANERVIDEVNMHKRVLEKASEDYLARKAEAPVATEEELDVADTSDDTIKVGGEITAESPAMSISPDYLNTAHDYSDMPLANSAPEIEYITEDEYSEEDGRDKEQILIHMGETEPLFISQGIVLQDWSELISPNILVHIYQACPPGTDKVVYVRNNRNDTDYEVIQELPG